VGGLKNDGGMAEYIIGDAENTVLLPDSLSFEQAAPLMCAGVSLPINNILQITTDPFRRLYGMQSLRQTSNLVNQWELWVSEDWGR
jgi:hypothetical protein